MKSSCVFACLCLASAASRPIKSSEIDPASEEQGLVPKESVAKAGERRVGRAGAPSLRGREPKERVWNGKKAPKGEFPWMVALHTDANDLYEEQFCGGSLIAPQWALGRVREPGSYVSTSFFSKNNDDLCFSRTVVIGAWNLDKWKSESYGGFEPEEIAVDDVILHKKYYRSGSHHDIALVHLKEPSSLPPVEVAESVPAVGEPITVMGWGALHPEDDDDEPRYTPKLQIVDLLVLPNKMCRDDDDDDFKNSVEICTGDPDEEQNAMPGDSGGPYVVKDPQTGEWNQVGLVSRGGRTIDITTDVVALKGWIDDQMASWKPFTTLKNCGWCYSSLDMKSPSKKTDSAEDCWLDCLWKHVNDEWNDANLVAIDWYPDTKKCWCQDACKYLHETNKDVVVIARGEALPAGAKEACGG